MDNKTFPRFRRRNYFIKRGLQGRFVAGFCSVVLLGFLLNLALAYYLIDGELAKTLYAVHLNVRATQAIIMPLLMRLGMITVPFIVAVSALIGYYLTRKMELPLNAFRDSVKRASHGDLDRGDKEDLSGELPEAFSRAVGSLEARFRSLKRRAAELERASERLAAVITGRENGPAAVDEMSDSIRTAGQEILGFKV